MFSEVLKLKILNNNKMTRRIFVLISIGILFFSVTVSSKSTRSIAPLYSVLIDSTEAKLMNQAIIIKKFIANKSNYNNEIVFLIDMKINSGKNRFFVYDLKNNKIIDQGLVAHGIGSGMVIENLKFSNTPNSYCTSLGKYSIGKSYNGAFGKSYKLYGLDETNNNALKRNIVLHKYDKVPYLEQSNPICRSLGCPMVNEQYYRRIEKLIDNSKSKIILDIYY